jgi:phage tail protein X
LRGTVLPGGADWQIVRPDGVTELQAHYILHTHDRALIQVRNRGLRHGPADTLDRIANREALDPFTYYCRTTPIFEALPGATNGLIGASL